MQQEALEYLVELGKTEPKIIDLFDEGETVKKLVILGSEKSEIHTFQKPPVIFSHKFSTLKGFTNYLSSDHCKDTKNGIIFVGKNAGNLEIIEAHLNYQSHTSRKAILELQPSEEFAALKLITEKSIDQRGLWQLLISKLDGCLPDSLLLTISSIKMSGTTETGCSIDLAGTSSGNFTDKVILTFNDAKSQPQQTQIDLNWEWEGRIWECFENTYKIPLRLEIQTKEKLSFQFHPRRLQTILSQAKQDLVEQIKSSVPEDRFTVHEGTY